MKDVFQQLAEFLISQSDTFVYENEFDAETLKSLVAGFAEEFERRVH